MNCALLSLKQNELRYNLYSVQYRSKVSLKTISLKLKRLALKISKLNMQGSRNEGLSTCTYYMYVADYSVYTKNVHVGIIKHTWHTLEKSFYSFLWGYRSNFRMSL